jgi:hypothetical protein
MESLEPRLLRSIDLSFAVQPLGLVASGYTAFTGYEAKLETFESTSPPGEAGPPVKQTTSGLSELDYYSLSPTEAATEEPLPYADEVDTSSPVVSDSFFNYNFNVGATYNYALEPYIPGVYYDGSSFTINLAVTNTGNTAVPQTAIDTTTTPLYPRGNVNNFTPTFPTATNAVRVDVFLSPTPSITMQAPNGGGNEPDGYSVPDNEYYLGSDDIGPGLLPGATRLVSDTFIGKMSAVYLNPGEHYYVVIKVDPLGEAVDSNGFGEQNVSNNTWASPYADVSVAYTPGEGGGLPFNVQYPQQYTNYLFQNVLNRGDAFDAEWQYTPHNVGTPQTPELVYTITEPQDLKDLISYSDPITFGQSTPQATLATFEASDEYAYENINAAYEQVFNRAVDITGLTYFTPVFRASSAPNIVQQLAASDEFYQDSGGTNALYVDGLYNVLLGREVDPSGLNYWTAQLNAGASHLFVAESISNSFEGRDLLVQQAYTQYLGRDASASEQSYWAGYLTSGHSYQSMIYDFVFSTEANPYILYKFPGQ